MKSETESTFFNRRASGLWIAGAFVLLLIVVVVRVLSPSPPIPEPIKVSEPRRVQRTPQSVFDAEAYYQTIIDNNLFRPLGWRPPRPIEPYRLLGTVLATDAHTPPQAIIESTAGKKTYIVSIGDPLDVETEVVSIESKQVTLSRNGSNAPYICPSDDKPKSRNWLLRLVGVR